MNSALKAHSLLGTYGTVRHRAWAGTYAAAAFLAVRSSRPRRACGTGGQRCDYLARRRRPARARCLAGREIAVGRPRSLLARRAAGLRAVAPRVAARAAAVAARGTRGCRTPAGGREARHAALTGAPRRPSAPALRAGQRRAARDRLRSEIARRGADEPRQPEPGNRPGRRHPARAHGGARLGVVRGPHPRVEG